MIDVDDIKILTYSEFNKTYQSIDVLIIVATDIELNESHKFLQPFEDDGRIIILENEGHSYYAGLYGSFIAVIVQTKNTGSLAVGAAVTTALNAIELLNPKIILMPGIAFGNKNKVKQIGDILIAKTIESYEQQRVEPDDTKTYRGKPVSTNKDLFEIFSINNNYQFQLSKKHFNVNIYSGSLLSGEKLVDNEHYRDDLFNAFPDVIGGEMEGVGIGLISHCKSVPWLLIKAVCDWAEEKNTPTKKSDQELAAYAAMSFCHKILSQNNKFEKFKMKAYTPNKILTGEIILDVEDIVKQDLAKRNHHQIKNYKPSVKGRNYNYSYYYHIDELKGWLFLGRDIRISKLFEHFESQIGPNNIPCPSKLEICMPKNAIYKEKSVNDILTSQFKSMKEGVKLYSLDQYINILTRPESNINPQNTREYLVDQDLFKQNNNEDNQFDNLGSGMNYFEAYIKNNLLAPVSIIRGIGGVGKSTFCDMLISKMYKEKCFIMISGESIVDKFNISDNIQINTIIELFEYYQKIDPLSKAILPETFTLNYLSGNVVVIIDGLDEIASVMSEKFNLEYFLKSLEDLDKRFLSSNIIITTRDIPIEKYIQTDKLEVFTLNGFLEKDIEKFLKSRLKNKADDIQKAKNLMTLYSLNDINQRVIPLFAELICDSIELHSLSPEDYIEAKAITDEDLINSYLDTNIIFDRVISIIMFRETKKQSLKMSLDNMIELFFEIGVANNNNQPISDFDVYLETFSINKEYTRNEARREKYKKHPLLKIDSYVQIKYESIWQLIKMKYAEYALKEKIYEEYYKVYNVFKEMYLGTGYLYQELSKNIYFKSNEDIGEYFRFFILKFLTLYEAKTTNEHLRETLRKAISGLLYLAFDIYKLKTKIERTNLLLELYNVKRIEDKGILKYLFIYGTFYNLNFENISICDSKFDGYSSLKSCDFPEKYKKPIFYTSTFVNTNLPAVKKLEKGYFHSCDLDETIQHAIQSNGQEQQSNSQDSITKDFIAITLKILDFQKGTISSLMPSLVLKTSHISVENFLDKLTLLGYLSQENNTYWIADEYQYLAKKIINNKIIPIELVPLIKKLKIFLIE